jgi:hypothetical protein
MVIPVICAIPSFFLLSNSSAVIFPFCLGHGPQRLGNPEIVVNTLAGMAQTGSLFTGLSLFLMI